MRVRWACLLAGMALLWSGLPALGAQAEVLHLRNGDRLTGLVLSEDNDQVTFKTSWYNVVVIPRSEISRREPSGQGTVPGVPPPPGTAVAPTAKAMTPSTPAIPKPPKRWGAELQVGADLLFSEKNRQLYTGRVKVTYAHKKIHHLFDYLFSYGETEGVLSENRMFGSLKSDYDLTRRLYVYNLGGAGYDSTRRIDVRYEIGPGFGWHLLKTTNLTANVEFGGNYQAQYLDDRTETEQFYFRFAEEVAWKLGPRLSWDEKFEFFPEVEDWSQYRLRFESNLRFLLFGNLSFILTVLDQYDTVTAEGVGKNDLQIRSSLGWKF